VTTPVLYDPAWLPHALEPAGVRLVRSSPERLRAASFLDGREPFGEEKTSVSFAAFAEAAAAWPVTRVPSVLHVSFCGSTLLSRLLDVPGRTIVYREPAIHIALADRVSAGFPLPDVLRQTSAAFARRVGEARPIVKPTSWANALIPAWVAARAIDPVFVTMAARDFLRAVFRGGHDRIGFTMRLASHLRSLVTRAPAWLEAATGERGEPLDVAARVTLVALGAQTALMRDARATLHLSSERVIDASGIFSDPRAAGEQVASIFGLDRIDGEAAGRHAKAPGALFSRNHEQATNQAMEAHHAARFDAALRWAERTGLRFDA